MSDVPPSGPAPPRFAPPQNPTPPVIGQPPPHDPPPFAGDGAPPPPTGLGAAGHYGAPVDLIAMQTPAPGTTGPVPAPFLRRAAAAVLSNLAFLAIAVPGIWGIRWLTGFADRNTATCEVGAVLTVCESNGWARLAGAGVAFAFTTAVSYLFFARPLHAHPGTVGMRQTGLVVRRVSDHSSADITHSRLHWMGSSMPQALSGLVVGLAWTDISAGAWTVALAVYGVIVLLTVAGALAAAVSDHTVWDRWSGVEVVAERPVAWVAVAAAIVGSLIPVLAVATLALSDFDDLRDKYAELTSSTTETTTLLAFLAPVTLLTVLTIVLGQVGLHVTRWGVTHPAGDGAARAGAMLGWSVPAIVCIAVIVNLTTDRVESLNESNCRDARKDIQLAISSYQTLNGALPPGLSSISGPAYLGESPDAERWEYAIDPSGPAGYRLTGVGDCARD